ncbi:MAG: transporter substrate-binding domain-containing protein, partial [Chromatiaceae bacterium]
MKFANAIISWCLLASLTLLSCDQGSQNPTSVGAGGERRSAPTKLAAAAGQSGGTGSRAGGWRSLDDLARGRMGVILGTVFAPYVEQAYPQARVTTFNSTTDQVIALKTGKVDTAIFDAISAQAIIKAHPELGILDEGFLIYPLGIGFRRDRSELRERFDRFLERLHANGGYEEMERRWFAGNPEQAVMPDYPVRDPKERYVLGASVADLPYVAFKDGRYVGLDIEILQRFAAEEGLGLEILSLDFGALIPALAAGKVDIITDGIAITAERRKAVDFSTPYAQGRAVALTLNASLAKETDAQPPDQPTALAAPARTDGWTSLDDLALGRFGIVLGSILDGYIQKTYPEARITRFHNAADMLMALKTDKVDVVLMDRIKATAPLKANPDLAVLPDDFFQAEVGVGFRKDSPELRQRFDNFLEEIERDGMLNQMQRRWIDNPEHAVMPDISVPSAPRERLNAAGVIGDLPFITLREGEHIGLDIELLKRFAAHEGLDLHFKDLDFGSLIPALVSGKVDIVSYGIYITDERRKSIDFSRPYLKTQAAAIVRREKLATPVPTSAQTQAPVARQPRQTPAAAAPRVGGGGWQSMADLAHGRIAVFTSTAQDMFATRAFPRAEILRFNSQADFVLALKTGKVDAAITEAVSIRAIAQDDPELAVLADDFYDMPIGAAFPKGDDRFRQRFDRFVVAARADGTLAAIQRRWLVDDPESVVMPNIPPAASGETLRAGTSLMVGLPFIAQADGRYIGHDMEVLQTFAAREGLRLEMVPMEFDALIASLAFGKIDMILSRLSITDERRAKVDFSVPYDHEHSAALVQKRNLATDPAVGPGESRPEAPPSPIAADGWRSLDDLARGRIAVFAGAIQDQYVARTYPEAEVIHLTGHADLITSLKTGKVDAGIIIATSAPDILKANPEIGLLGEPILPVPQAAAFRHQDRDLRERFDRFMAGILADGTHTKMHVRWFEGDPHQAKIPAIPLRETGPALRLGTSVFVGLPYVGMVNGEYVGFDIELARRFAAHEDLRLEISPLEFSALIPALAAGKLDLVVSALAVTQERQRQVSFSIPYAEVSSVTLALKENLT